jgi:hypothetical protein
MANKVYYNGSPGAISGSTPFAFYDLDTTYQIDGPKVANFCARKLGYPMMDVELQDQNFYTCFEEAVTTYGNELYLFKIRDNYLSLEGSPTGSALNTTVINSGLNSIINISTNYGEAIGVGGYTNIYKGALPVISGQQSYDMKAWASASASLTPGDSIVLTRIFYEPAPAVGRFFDPFTGTGFDRQGMLESFGWGAQSSVVSTMLFPVFWDIQRIQEIEMSDTVRRSHYSFEVVNNVLKIFPIPISTSNPAWTGTLWFEYSKQSEMNSPSKGPYSGSANLVTNMGNVPYNNPVYSQINAPGRYWIYEYSAALAKEMLGYVRGKYTTVPIPGAEATLNQQDLLADARTEKANLIEKLRGDLDEMTRKSQLERKQAETVAAKGTLNEIPQMIFIG